MRFHFVIRRFNPLLGAGPALVLASLALGFLATDAARADVATLKSGRTIEVASFRLNGDRVELSLPGGGQIALPAGEVREIRRQPLTSEVVPPAAPAAPAATGPADTRSEERRVGKAGEPACVTS